VNWHKRYREFEQLCSAQSSQILQHAAQSWAGINFSKKEPEIVHEYLASPSRGVWFLNQTISPLLSVAGYEVKFGSVFIHQKPRVTLRTAQLPPNNQCELGDLLVVFVFMDAAKNPLVCRAFLAQAKKGNALDSACQQALYDLETSFDFPKNLVTSSPCCTTSPTRFLPVIAHRRWQGLNYLMLNEPQPVCHFVPWGPRISTSWSTLILYTIMGIYGRSFSTHPYPGQGWSAIVWDLLRVTSKAVAKGKTRGNHLESLANEFNDFRDRHEFFRWLEDEFGIPTLMIMVRDGEGSRAEIDASKHTRRN